MASRRVNDGGVAAAGAGDAVGWMVIGPYFELAYITKGIEAALLTLLVVDSFRVYGGPAGLVTEALVSIREAVASIRR